MPYTDTDAYLVSIGSVAQLIDVGSKGAVGSVRDGGNARNRPVVVAVWVEATNSALLFVNHFGRGCVVYGYAIYGSLRSRYSHSIK
ncbi:hypothetical protein J1N35_005389 [Gossypium stocksii]|uniref:Uncharacterized protein n=1 Tax=Gossypium stocksii TaxID=47602 RepID=A0A9D3WDQ4_9ROSI|nr:hypothetical protein J1N35_005389 [Gossypium stocksii]